MRCALSGELVVLDQHHVLLWRRSCECTRAACRNAKRAAQNTAHGAACGALRGVCYDALPCHIHAYFCPPCSRRGSLLSSQSPIVAVASDHARTRLDPSAAFAFRSSCGGGSRCSLLIYRRGATEYATKAQAATECEKQSLTELKLIPDSTHRYSATVYSRAGASASSVCFYSSRIRPPRPCACTARLAVPLPVGV